MRIDEILSAEEKLKFAQLILASTYTEIAKAVGLTEPKRMLPSLAILFLATYVMNLKRIHFVVPFKKKKEKTIEQKKFQFQPKYEQKK